MADVDATLHRQTGWDIVFINMEGLDLLRRLVTIHLGLFIWSSYRKPRVFLFPCRSLSIFNILDVAFIDMFRRAVFVEMPRRES
jgi:hypothetical protein